MKKVTTTSGEYFAYYFSHYSVQHIYEKWDIPIGRVYNSYSIKTNIIQYYYQTQQHWNSVTQNMNI